MLTPVEPRVRIELDNCVAEAPTERRWWVSWIVRNDGSVPLELQAAWIPHGRFRGNGRVPLSGSIAPDDATALSFAVTTEEDAGTVVENAFLILRVLSDGQAWQIFTRMRIEFDAQACPLPIVEVVTLQSLK
jgi:hypothetical protein